MKKPLKTVKTPKLHYVYDKVPESIFKQLMDANEANNRIGDHQVSVGSLFHTLIKLHPDKYPFSCVEGHKVEMHKVDSSTIQSIGWWQGVLHVSFVQKIRGSNAHVV